jgi:hypothetical protein
VYSPAAGTPFPEKPISHVQESMSDCPTDLATRREIDEVNHSPRHSGIYATCVPSQEEDGQTKNTENQRWREGRSKVTCRETVEMGEDR